MNGFPGRNHVIIWIEDLDKYKASWKKMISLDIKKVYPSRGRPFPKEKLVRCEQKLDKIRLYSLKNGWVREWYFLIQKYVNILNRFENAKNTKTPCFEDVAELKANKIQYVKSGWYFTDMPKIGRAMIWWIHIFCKRKDNIDELYILRHGWAF